VGAICFPTRFWGSFLNSKHLGGGWGKNLSEGFPRGLEEPLLVLTTSFWGKGFELYLEKKGGLEICKTAD